MNRATDTMLLGGAKGPFEDVRYLAGFGGFAPAILLVSGKSKLLVVSELEALGARAKTRGAQVITPNDLGITGAARAQVSAWAVAALKHLRKKAVSVPCELSVGIVNELTSNGIRVTIMSGPACPQREIKKPREIENIRTSQRAAAEAMRAAMKMIAASRPDSHNVLRLGGEPLTSERVRERIEEVFLAHRCVAVETIVSGGRSSADPHNHGTGPLRANEPILMDLFPLHKEHGYWGDISRTVVRGKAPPELRKMYNAVRAAQKIALSEVRAGSDARNIHNAALVELQRRGFKTCIQNGRCVGLAHSVGHGVGLHIHEPPFISVVPATLKAGNVITVEPGLYYPKIGGVRIEDTVVVTRTGYRPLASCNYVLEL
jgi:Xaa-Pro aminopeptidase